MKSTTLKDLGRHAGERAVEAINVVAQLVDELDERGVLQAYAAGMVCSAMISTIVEAEREQRPLVVDEALVRGIMADLTNIVVGGVMLGEKMLVAEKG